MTTSPRPDDDPSLPAPPPPPRRSTPRVSRALTEEGAPATGGAAERILEAAARVLAERGAAGLSMQDVAQEAGVSKGLIHYHYRDRPLG